MKAFASDGGDTAGAEQLGEVFSDAMLSDLGIGRAELIELADNAPAVSEGVVRLYTALRELQRRPPGAAEGEATVDPRSLSRRY